MALILLCSGSWTQRAGLLFDIFKCIGSEEMSYEDFILAAHVGAASLCRLWGVELLNNETISLLSEKIADNAFSKVVLQSYFVISISH